MHAGVLVGPGKERRGTSETGWNRTRDTAVGPGCRADQSCRVPCQEIDEAAREATALRAPDRRGERERPPVSAPYLNPFFQNTTPPSHDGDTRSPVYFGHFIPFGHFILLFLFNKSLSKAWCHTPVSVVCSSRHHIQKCTPNIHVCTFKYGWGSWMLSFEFIIKIPRLLFNDRMIS